MYNQENKTFDDYSKVYAIIDYTRLVLTGLVAVVIFRDGSWETYYLNIFSKNTNFFMQINNKHVLYPPKNRR